MKILTVCIGLLFLHLAIAGALACFASAGVANAQRNLVAGKAAVAADREGRPVREILPSPYRN